MADTIAALPGRIAPLREVAVDSQLLFDRADIVLPRSVLHHNVADFNAAFARHLDNDVYPERPATAEAVRLEQLPAGTTVHGDLHFLATWEDTLLREQFHRDLHDNAAVRARALAEQASAVQVDEPCLLVARFGEWTWGHWLGELLPRAVAAEMTAPGKFRYAVPEDTTDPSSTNPVVRNVLGSLRAYGIPFDRLLRMSRRRRYAFRALSAVTSIWSYPYVMHPAANAMMRTRLREAVPPAPAGAAAAALMRNDATQRGIRNATSVLDLLKTRGFAAFAVGSLPFIDQVAMFRESSKIFSVLGSTLTGLIYSPEGVRVLSVAPGAWGDRFFYALIQARRGKYVDIRGRPEEGAKDLMRASFTPSLEEISKGLELLERA